MIILKVEEREYKLASEWSEVTFRQFMDILSLKEDEYVNETDKLIKSLVILSGDERIYKDIKQMFVTDFQEVKKLFDYLYQDVEEQYRNSGKNEFEINGEKFCLLADFNKSKVGEMISAELMLQDSSFDLQPNEIAFGILFRRLNEDGTMAEFNPDDMIKIIKELSNHIYVTDVIGTLGFFLNGGNNSTSETSKVSFTIVPKMSSEECQPKKSKSTIKKKKSI